MLGAALPAALAQIERVTDPAQQKRDLVRRIRSVCRPAPGEDAMAAWVSGAAADLVVFYGVAEEELEKILANVEGMRQVGVLRSAPAFFHFKVRELAARLGKPWPGGGGEGREG